MTSSLPPASSAANHLPLPLPGAATPAAAAPTGGAATPAVQTPVQAPSPVPVSAPAPSSRPVAAPVSVPVAAPVTPPVRFSAEMLQSLRLQAFEQLVAQLAMQVQSRPGVPAPQWPASGVSQPLQQLLQALLAQVATAQGQPLQLLSAQPGSVALLQALAAASQAAAPASAAAAGGPPSPSPAPQPAAAAAATAALAAAAVRASAADALLAGRGALPLSSSVSPALAAADPSRSMLGPLQNWWVQQGTLQTPQGERGFVLSLQVPQAWAQAQGAAVALPAGAAPALAAGAAATHGLSGMAGAGWNLPLDVPLQSLASGPVALVLQPRGGDDQRTSALLLLELQPLRQASGQVLPTAPLATLSPALAQEMQQLLQNRGDPWLQMAVAQSSGAMPRERPSLSEHRSHFCTTEGCQYEGRAPCAQPFCSEMNRIWSVSRMERSR